MFDKSWLEGLDGKAYVSIQKLRHDDRHNELKQFIKVVCGPIIVPLVISFWCLDIFFAPEFIFEFLLIRSVTLAVSLGCFVAIKYSNSSLFSQFVGTVFTLSNAWAITIMVFYTGGPESIYYAGLNLAGFGVITFIPWQRTFLLLNTVLIYLPFVAGSLLFYSKVSPTFIVYCTFIVATVFISLVVRSLTEKIRFKEATSRFMLEREITNRDDIIAYKTEESIRFQELSRQFSPQVIAEIQVGNLGMWQPVKRVHICSMFIDIVDSTKRVVSIPPESLKKVINKFLLDVMPILLKYDITIDKFLGDGILAFSNQPIVQDDYVGRVVQAAVEIRRRIKDHQAIYLDWWGDPLQITLGIAEGEADVGFYGDSETLKSYTALGEVVNLSARLCAHAHENQILVSETVAKKLSDQEFYIESQGKLRLKGFSNEGEQAFSVDKIQNRTSNVATPKCPSGHGFLVLRRQHNGIFDFCCRVCDYYICDSDDVASAA